MDELEGVRLEHKLDGHICGGNPETQKIAKLLHFVNVDFKSSEKIDDYLKHKRDLMNIFKSTFPSETLYTLVNIFTTKCDHELRSHIEELTPRKGYFTSFEHFLREFEEHVYPNSRQAAYMRFINRSIPVSAKIAVEWKKFKEDAKLVHMDPVEHNLLFFEGFQHLEKKKALLHKWFMTKDMELVLREAIAMESTLEMIKMWDQAKPDEGKGKKNQNQNSNASVNAINVSGGGKKGKQQAGQQQQQQQKQGQQQQQSQQQQPQQELSKNQQKQLRLRQRIEQEVQQQYMQQQQQQNGGKGGGGGGKGGKGGGGKGGGNKGGGGGKEGGATVAANEVHEAAIKQSSSNQPVHHGWTGPASAPTAQNVSHTLSNISMGRHNNLIPPNECLSG